MKIKKWAGIPALLCALALLLAPPALAAGRVCSLTLSCAVGGSPVPVLHIGGNMDDCARKNFHSRLSFFLIPAASGHTDKHLPAAFRRFVNMPVIAATGFKSYIGDIHLFA